MIRVDYIGFSDIMLKNIINCKDLIIKNCYCESRRCNDKLKKICEKYGVIHHIHYDKQELKLQIDQNNNNNYIMYEYDMIIPKELIERVNIFNFHPGSLENNRGRNPIINSVIRGDFYTKMTVYRIGAIVDFGDEICSSIIKIENNDNSKSIKGKLEDTIPELLVKLSKYIGGGEKRKFTEPGIYCDRISLKDYQIDLNRDTLQDVIRKVKSQALYKGAILNSNYIRNIEVEEYKWKLVSENNQELKYEVLSVISMTKNESIK